MVRTGSFEAPRRNQRVELTAEAVGGATFYKIGAHREESDVTSGCLPGGLKDKQTLDWASVNHTCWAPPRN